MTVYKLVVVIEEDNLEQAEDHIHKSLNMQVFSIAEVREGQ